MIHTFLSQMSYADGAANGEESAFQSAFDQGYKEGLKAAFEIGKFKYFFNHLDDKLSPEDLVREKQKYLSMNVKEAEESKQFFSLNNREENVSEISEKQQQHVDNLLAKFKAEVPKVVDLLNAT